MRESDSFFQGLAFRGITKGDIAWKIVVVALLILCGRYFWSVLAHPSTSSFMDFSAFYCADHVLAARGNPYDAQSLAVCERAVAPWRSGEVVTAPYPPYALLLIYPLSLLPFNIAAMIWLAGIAMATCIACILIAKLAHAPLVVAIAAFASSLWFPSMIAASLEAYPVLFLLLAAFWLREERWTFGAFALGLAMTKPNIALPACLASFVAFPELRVRLGLVGLALFALQFVLGSPGLFFAYFPFLHGHAVRELDNAWQYSLAYGLHMIGVPDAVAVEIGFVQYAVAALAGIFIGIFLRKKFRENSWPVLAPIAVAIVGGIYSREQELAVAIPFCVALAYRAKSLPAAYALLLLAIPWSAVYGDIAYVPFAMLTVGTLIHQMWKPNWLLTVGGALAAIAVLLYSAPSGSDAITSNAGWFSKHLPAWLGLALMMLAAGAAIAANRNVGVAALEPST